MREAEGRRKETGSFSWRLSRSLGKQFRWIPNFLRWFIVTTSLVLGVEGGPGSSSFNDERQWGPETHRFLKTTGPIWKKLLLEEIKSLRDLQRGGYKRRERYRGHEDKEVGIRGHQNATKMLATVETFASGHMRGLLSVMKWCLGWEQLMQVWSLKAQEPSYGNSL